MNEKSKKNKYRGFDLNAVTWGYQDIFKKSIDRLYGENLLGKTNEKATEVFFRLLEKTGEKPHFDHIVKDFLVSLNEKNQWIMNIPSLFSKWCRLGFKFGREKMYMGLNFFQLWAEGKFGNTPQELSYVIDKAHFLIKTDYGLAYNFIEGYFRLRENLSFEEIDVFLDYALQLYRNNAAAAYSFLNLRTKTSRYYIRMISREARLKGLKHRLTAYGKAISGQDIQIDGLNKLDSDELIEKGSYVICLSRWFYFPVRVDVFAEQKSNNEYYMFMTATASVALSIRSFSAVHGCENFSDSLEYISKKGTQFPVIVNNLFICTEIYRVLSTMYEIFPGIRETFKKIIKEELKHRKRNFNGDELLDFLLKQLCGEQTGNSGVVPLAEVIKSTACSSADFNRTLFLLEKKVKQPGIKKLGEKYMSSGITPLTFFPDFNYRGEISIPPDSMLSADLKDSLPSGPQDGKKERTGKGKTGKKSRAGSGVQTGYFYDEWNQQQRDYYENWCCLQEKMVGKREAHKKYLNEDFAVYAGQMRKIFEKLKPDLAEKEKYLEYGDYINIDRLVEYLTLKKARISGKTNFYEKKYIKKRDIAVAVLLDVSGSTGEEVDDKKKMIDFAKAAAYILAEGLSAAGDEFGIFGFTGAGRENAEYYILKDFSEKWDEKSKNSLFGVSPGSSTRIGVALRHTGRKLGKVSCKKKIIILITDGKPMDTDYDPNTNYAQYDVRKANEENRKKNIYTFCISTEKNKIKDLEIMFPDKRFVITQSFRELPRLLSAFYLKLTT
jgi:Mg-chelatase subunit ChlD